MRDTGYGYGIRGANWPPNAEYSPDTGFKCRIQNTEWGPTEQIRDTDTGYGIRSLPHSVRCSWYRIQIQNTGCRAGPTPTPSTKCKIQMQDTGYRVCPTPSHSHPCRNGIRIRDTDLPPLLPAVAAVQCRIQCTGYNLGPKYRGLIRNWAILCRVIRYEPYLDLANPRARKLVLQRQSPIDHVPTRAGRLRCHPVAKQGC